MTRVRRLVYDPVAQAGKPPTNAPEKHPLSKLMHLDFRRWRDGRVVLTRSGTELVTDWCRRCKKTGLAVAGWRVHVAVVDTLGYRLLPHDACAPEGMSKRAAGKPPIVYVPKVEIEEATA